MLFIVKLIVTPNQLDRSFLNLNCEKLILEIQCQEREFNTKIVELITRVFLMGIIVTL